MCLFQQEDLVPDRFVIYGEDYKKVREAMAKTVLSATHRELTEVLQVWKEELAYACNWRVKLVKFRKNDLDLIGTVLLWTYRD